ncbi:ROK family protein [Tepidanaerobacter sp. GT38]|uniref:ROK family protein n=1 Tax=Tepidanaerobacter sp. GT38 TaxID=2722793 RepID=UPI001F41AD44|nr:ROK family protein [Tepidanaerobacter sp. GT38]MCG1011334.1 ROK family protein [Tepidanaerobacter sp. GT38]
MVKLVVGLDLGGTKIATCVMNEDGEILKKVTLSTLAHEGPDAVIGRIIESIYDVIRLANINKEDILAIGVGVPGPLDSEKGLIKNPPNLPGWVEVPLRDILYKEFKVPLAIENDANAAALGENIYGSGKGIKNFMYITISTGIGGGVVVNGKLLKGASGNAAEIGHTTINFEGPLCGCGNRGCWEAYASGTALARFAREGIKNGIKTIIKDIVDREGHIKAEHVFTAAKQGDKFAKELVDMEGFYLGVGLANMANSFNPNCIAIGGGITNQWDMFYEHMISIMQERALKANVEGLKVVKATLGPDVGVIGAATLAWRLVQ